MHPLLQKLLNKRGIEDVTELVGPEKDQYDKWQGVLSEGEMSVEKIKQFCEMEIKTIHEQWKNLDNTPAKNERLVLIHTIYQTLLAIINSPRTDREALERYLTNLIE